MLTITPYKTNNMHPQSFQAHLPKTFGGMMNYIYKSTPDMFEFQDTMRVSAKLDNGLDVSGTVYFDRGKYKGLVMDEGFEDQKQSFIKTALDRYRKRIASKKVQEKLEKEANKHKKDSL